MSSAVNNDEMHSHETREETEDRLRRLETAIAAMQDTKLMEERLLERVMSRVEQAPSSAPLAPPPVATFAPPNSAPGTESLVGSGMALLPGAIRAVSSEIGRSTNPQAAIGQKPTFFAAQSWLLTDMLQEFRTFGAMFLDYRFHTSWTVRIIPLACLILIVLNYFMLTQIPERIADLVLVVLAYKTLSREAIRYRTEMAAYPPGR